MAEGRLFSCLCVYFCSFNVDLLFVFWCVFSCMEFVSFCLPVFCFVYC